MLSPEVVIEQIFDHLAQGRAILERLHFRVVLDRWVDPDSQSFGAFFHATLQTRTPPSTVRAVKTALTPSVSFAVLVAEETLLSLPLGMNTDSFTFMWMNG